MASPLTSSLSVSSASVMVAVSPSRVKVASVALFAFQVPLISSPNRLNLADPSSLSVMVTVMPNASSIAMSSAVVLSSAASMPESFQSPAKFFV